MPKIPPTHVRLRDDDQISTLGSGCLRFGVVDSFGFADGFQTIFVTDNADPTGDPIEMPYLSFADPFVGATMAFIKNSSGGLIALGWLQ